MTEPGRSMTTPAKRLVYPPHPRPEGWHLAHNNVRHTARTRDGTHGFRYFYRADVSGWTLCHCGWRPELGVHYAIHEGVALHRAGADLLQGVLEMSGDPIGSATMGHDRTIVLRLHADDPSGIVFAYPPHHPVYARVLAHLGGLEPGESKPVPPWPDDADNASIGTATMRPDRTIVLMLRADDAAGTIGDARFVFPTGHPDYATVLAHLGGLEPGESKPVPPWPTPEAGQ
jgi:hypothetical protein